MPGVQVKSESASDDDEDEDAGPLVREGKNLSGFVIAELDVRYIYSLCQSLRTHAICAASHRKPLPRGHDAVGDRRDVRRHDASHAEPSPED